MIAPPRQKTTKVDAPAPAETPRASLPGFGRLASVACWTCAPLLAIFLVKGWVWSSLSLVVGLVLSLTVCSMLYLFVARGMDYLVARGQGGAAEKNGSVLSFAVLLPLKFVLVGLIGWALLTLHSINYLVVLIGFMLAQTAITVTAARHFKKR